MIVNLTSFAVVREREVGTLEQIMVTPIRPLEFIIGKTIPFFFVGLAMTALIAVAGTLWFQIPFVGNPFVLLLGTSLYLLSVLGIGLLISTVCFTQQQAFATNFFVVNPAFILSGFSFPIASMPPLMQWLSTINPMTYYLIVIRGTFIKGVGLTVLCIRCCARGARPYFAATACSDSTNRSINRRCAAAVRLDRTRPSLLVRRHCDYKRALPS
jgi:ABC-2 type transport system permease protein